MRPFPVHGKTHFAMIAFTAALVFNTQAIQTQQAQVQQSQSEFIEIVRREADEQTTSQDPLPTSQTLSLREEISTSTSSPTTSEAPQLSLTLASSSSSLSSSTSLASSSSSTQPSTSSISPTSTAPLMLPHPTRPHSRTDDDNHMSGFSVIFLGALTVSAIICFGLWYHRRRQQSALPQWTVTYDTTSFINDQHNLENGEYPEYDEDGPTDRCKFGVVEPGKYGWEKKVSTPGRVAFTTKQL